MILKVQLPGEAEFINFDSADRFEGPDIRNPLEFYAGQVEAGFRDVVYCLQADSNAKAWIELADGRKLHVSLAQ